MECGHVDRWTRIGSVTSVIVDTFSHFSVSSHGEGMSASSLLNLS